MALEISTYVWAAIANVEAGAAVVSCIADCSV
jgi:hypothetical protein